MGFKFFGIKNISANIYQWPNLPKTKNKFFSFDYNFLNLPYPFVLGVILNFKMHL